ncbi:MAG: GIY-YIG nuclease family protein [Alphaproteobacteria bacterium]|nr:GIY-YIG nuclease family protein [Alphaproteobacteria bacterium]
MGPGRRRDRAHLISLLNIQRATGKERTVNENRVCAVYILASGRCGTLYTGVTSDLLRRVWEHREGIGSSFTRKYGVARLAWFEIHDWYDAARQREKQIKEWRRAWKLNLIERDNPNWDDLWFALR